MKTAPDSAHIPETASRILTAESRNFSIDVLTQAQELSDNQRTDSTHRRSQFQAQLSPRLSGWELQLRGQRVLSDSTGGAKRLAADTTDTLTIELRERAAQFAPISSGMHCMGTGALLSPLIARLVIPPINETNAQQRSSKDTLTYQACSAGTELTTSAFFEFVENESSQSKVTIHGQLQSDSTKKLPLRITGSFTGEGTISLSNIQLPLAQDLELHLRFDLTAESSLKKQHFKQATTIRIRQLP
jgi:hypothetical protein